MVKIDIFDQNASGPDRGRFLQEFLKRLGSEGSQMTWVIFPDFWAGGDVSRVWRGGIVELERQVHDSRNGVIVTWEQIQALASKIDQLIDGVIAGYKDKTTIPGRRIGDETAAGADVVFKAVDSSYWRLCIKDENLVTRLVRGFSDVRHIPADT
jgi:hypothetical protein